ncbi:segregation/condensation protein A [Clostridiaceae bacterium 35-E11]
MAYNVKLEVFEGPFDLLFHLIEKAQVDIYNIPIATIAEQYIQYIQEMKDFDLEVTSEFLVMAATLLEIKSKMLLPQKQEEQLEIELESEDPRKELVKRLIEYKKYKHMAIELKKREEVYKKVFYKQQEQLDQFIVCDEQELDNLELKDLLEAFHRLVKKRIRTNENRLHFNEIKRDTFTIEYKIEQIKNLLANNNFLTFEQLFFDAYDKSEIVITFLALLELMKLKFILAQQNEAFGTIILKKNVISNEVQ